MANQISCVALAQSSRSHYHDRVMITRTELHITRVIIMFILLTHKELHKEVYWNAELGDNNHVQVALVIYFPDSTRRGDVEAGRQQSDSSR